MTLQCESKTLLIVLFQKVVMSRVYRCLSESFDTTNFLHREFLEYRNKGQAGLLVDKKTARPTCYSHVQSLVLVNGGGHVPVSIYTACFLKLLSEYSVVSFEKIVL